MSLFANVPSRRNSQPVKKTLDKEHARIAPTFEEQNDEIDYYGKTAHILFHYYDSVENGSQALDVPPPPAPVPIPANKISTGRKQLSIMDFINDNGPETSLQEPIPIPDKTGTTPPSIAGSPMTSGMSPPPPIFSSKYSKMSRVELLDSFLKTVDDGYVPEADKASDTRYMRKSLADTACPHCGSENRLLIPNEGFLHCESCDNIEYVTLDSERPSYRDPPRELSYFCYKRANHLGEWISQTQGREYTNIPDTVYDAIMVELKKQKITNVATLTPKKLKEVMKKLSLNKYYEHIPHILNHISGTPLARIPPALEAQLRRMFAQIQVPFMKHAPPNRRNFLSYSFVLHKFLQLLGHDELLEHFPLLKSRNKLFEQDRVWKDICKELNWEFIRTI
ncbi:putative late transcription factor VLTF3-like protein [Tetraselmis virus 1]|uniref:Putative late transcription factor VLTF3-like protein n=1 Tax=Tetraselmis virus 1 TaxID=2060617 RepID=A0A2P0VN57_9VIRU|nr:putative late transcription factor VLTF3-like protein [Tetraselmis virus 1]AUF82346.1 putative late transcription factor VLTF3-like protein [Tetraselmis virus 1]